MRTFFRTFVACGLVLQLVACAGTSAVESQSKQRDQRLARLYFLREKGLIGAMGGTAATAEIRVNGKSVGTVANGTYIFVDRPPGRYTLSVENKISVPFETEVEVESGQAYYFNLGPQRSGAPGTDLLTQAISGGAGEAMTAKSVLSAGFSGVVLYRLEPSAGAKEVQGLKAP